MALAFIYPIGHSSPLYDSKISKRRVLAFQLNRCSIFPWRFGTLNENILDTKTAYLTTYHYNPWNNPGILCFCSLLLLSSIRPCWIKISFFFFIPCFSYEAMGREKQLVWLSLFKQHRSLFLNSFGLGDSYYILYRWFSRPKIPLQ